MEALGLCLDELDEAMKIDGKCMCGQVRYEGRIDPERVAVCHCTDCQNHSATAFGLVAHLEEFTLTQGEMKTYEKIADSGARRALTFCPECGTRIYAKTVGGGTGFWGLRVGTCTQRRELQPKLQVWCQSRLPWVGDLGGLPEFPRQPELG